MTLTHVVSQLGIRQVQLIVCQVFLGLAKYSLFHGLANLSYETTSCGLNNVRSEKKNTERSSVLLLGLVILERTL